MDDALVEQELTDEEADALVGSADDTEPVELEERPDEEALSPPEDWNPAAHAEEYAADPDVEFTPLNDDGLDYRDVETGT